VNRLSGRLFSLLLTLAVLVPTAAAYDVGLEAGVSSYSGPLYRDTTALWPQLGFSAGVSATDWLYVGFDYRMDTASTATTFSGSVGTDWGTVGLQAAWISTPLIFRPDLGGYFATTFPLVGDLLSLDASLQVKTDLNGGFAQLKLAPTLYLPLSQPLMLGLVITQSAFTAGYDIYTFTGLAHLTARVEASWSLSPAWSLSGEAGYSLDDSGGQLASFPFGGAKANWSYGQ
jgi:hypothetical protein